MRSTKSKMPKKQKTGPKGGQLEVGALLYNSGLMQVRLIVGAGGRDVVELADQCEKRSLDRLMPLEVDADVNVEAEVDVIDL